MTQFVFFATQVTNAQFEKAFEIKVKAGELVVFLPQGGSQHGITSPGMQAVKSPQPLGKPALDTLLNVRFEWDEKGAEFGAEIVRALARNHEEPLPGSAG